MYKSASLEKLFFHFILENPTHFHNVPSHYFENEQIRYVYNVVKQHYSTAANPIVPSFEKITTLVRLDDRTSTKVSNDVLKTIYDVSLDPYQQTSDDKWLPNQFKGWILEHSARDRVLKSIEVLRELDDKNASSEDIEAAVDKIKNFIGDINLMVLNDKVGLDFDDPDSHYQDTVRNKIPTSWVTVDSILNGGWDLKTLNMFMGQSNVGKSTWMCNCAVNAANSGRNVLYVSCEMSDRKIMKRIGSTRLKIPIYDYDNLSRDKNFMKGKLQELHYGMNNKQNLFEQKLGKISVVDFPSGTLTVHRLDAFVKQWQQERGVKLDMLIIDYLTLMDAGKGMNENLYLKGKTLAEGVRAIAQKYNLVAISATQVSREAFNSNEINMKDMSESKAILETCDSLFAIMQNEEMKKQKIYTLKCLKNRDGEFKWVKARFEFDSKFMQLLNDSVIE